MVHGIIWMGWSMKDGTWEHGEDKRGLVMKGSDQPGVVLLSMTRATDPHPGPAVQGTLKCAL